jgi:hypothetical protein
MFPEFLSYAEIEAQAEKYRQKKVEKMLIFVLKENPEMSAKDAVQKAVELVDCLDKAKNA